MACLAGYCQEKKESALSVVSSDSLNVFIKNYLEQTTGRRFEDPEIPRFLIRDRGDMFVFGVGGYVAAEMIYDYGGNSDACFVPVDPTLTAHSNDVLGIDMSASRFFFKVLGNTKKGIIAAYIEGGFSEVGYKFALLKAYVDVLGLRVGLSNTAFSDDQEIPLLCGGMAISSNARAVPMIAYSYLFKSGIRLQTGFEFPQSTTIYSSENQTDERKVITVKMPHPDYTLSAYYDHKKLHLFAGGYLRLMQFFDNYDTQKFIYKPGFAFNVSGNYKFGSSDNFSQKVFLQAQYESMMADCFSNLADKGLSAIMPNRLGWSSYDFTQGVGGQIGYQINFGYNSFNLQSSVNKIFGHQNSGFDNLYDMGITASVNYLRSFFKYGTIGAEFEYGRNYLVGGNILSDFRAAVLLRYDF